MIRYALICDDAHEFESWFSTSSDFETLSRRKLVTCPVCASAEVARAIMAPSIARGDRGRGAPAEADETEASVPPANAPSAAAPAAPAPLALMGEKEVALRRMLEQLHSHVAKTAEHVGPRFADEALKIHHGESEGRAIYGQATPEDARMLQEEGVAFMPLPRLPQGRN